MNHNTIFTVKNSDLERLDPHTAVDFIRKLLWAEAQRVGIDISKIHVSTAIHVADGGIDASVEDAQIETGCGIIKQGKTSYQIKSGASEPWHASFIEKGLFRGATPDRQKLGESIRDCLDVDGTYVLVFTGIDLVESQRLNAIEHVQKCLKECNYLDAKVEVWSQNTLISFLEFFPSLALQVNGNDSGIFQTHRSWSRDADMDVQFIPGEAQTELIANIQAQLRRDDDTVHVRVLGEPGVGKTKAALEATRTDDLNPLVIYCTASQFRDSYLMSQILRDDNNFSAVLAIDECDADSRYYIWNKLQHRGPRIKLITIFNDHDPTSDRGISEFKISGLDDEQIRTIIQGYNVSTEQANRYLEFSGGSPRMAHHVGRTLASYPGDPSQLLTDDYLYKSFYIDFKREDPDSQEIEQRELVLQYIALFKKIGFERSVVTEAQAIAKKVEADNPLITWSKFKRTVDSMKNRKILQGEFTLYLTPKALHIKLWTEWWKIHGNSFDLEEFIRDLPPKLIEWFYEMFVYAAESEVASQIVKDLLGPNGPFQNDEHLKTKLGSRFFLALTEAHPKSALECLSRTVGTWDRKSLLRFKEGRREVVLALQKIAVWRDLFADAARLLLTLAEAENEGFSNNASGVFAELFSPGSGRVAPTEAPPSERLSILEEAFASGSEERRALALKACNFALESRDFVRFGNPEVQGLHKEPKLWMPKTYGELWDAYRAAWKLLEDQLPRLSEDERKKGVGVLLGYARGLTQVRNLAGMIVDTIAMITKRMYANKKEAIKTVNRILHYDGENFPAETRERWEKLMDELVGSDFHSMMQRYVGMDLLEDKFDENRNYVDQAQPRIEELAQQAVNTPFFLQSELDWLVTSEAKKGGSFGYELGKRDNGFSLLPTLLKAQRNAGDNTSTAFLGGYFRALFESAPDQQEAQLYAMIDDTKLKALIPALTSQSGLTDRLGLCLLNLAIEGTIGVNDFKIFAYSNAVGGLSDEVFGEWIALLLNVGNKVALSVALGLYHRYYVMQTSAPALQRELSFRLLSHQLLFKESDDTEFDDMIESDWTEVAKVYIHLDSEKHPELAELMLSHFGEDGSIFGPFSETCTVLDEITDQCTLEVWQQVSKLLEDEMHFSRTIALEQWLREGSSWGGEDAKPTLLRIPHELIWKWIDKDTENRAWYFAERLVPKTLSTKEWEGSIVRGLLIRYGEREDVRSSLRANYSTETFWGPTSLHYEEKIKTLLDIKNCEDNRNVRRWIDEFVAELEAQVGQETVHEEREP